MSPLSIQIELGSSSGQRNVLYQWYARSVLLIIILHTVNNSRNLKLPWDYVYRKRP